MAETDVFREFIKQMQEEYARRLDRACSEAIQGGVSGVLVTMHSPDSLGFPFEIVVSDRVPYGKIIIVRDGVDILAVLDRTLPSSAEGGRGT